MSRNKLAASQQYLLLIYMHIMLKCSHQLAGGFFCIFFLNILLYVQLCRYTTTIAAVLLILIKCENNFVNKKAAKGNFKANYYWWWIKENLFQLYKGKLKRTLGLFLGTFRSTKTFLKSMKISFYRSNVFEILNLNSEYKFHT